MATLTPHQDHVAVGLAEMRRLHAACDYVDAAAHATSSLSLALMEAALPWIAEQLDLTRSKEEAADALAKALGSVLATAAGHLTCCPPHVLHVAYALGHNAGCEAQRCFERGATATIVTDAAPMGRA